MTVDSLPDMLPGTPYPVDIEYEELTDGEQEFGFLSHQSNMRRIARGLRKDATNIQLINHIPDDVARDLKDARGTLDKAAAAHKAKSKSQEVTAKRQEVDKEIEIMFSRLDLHSEVKFPPKEQLAQCLTRHPLVGEYMVEKGVVSRLAEKFGSTKAVGVDVRMEVMDAVDDLKQGTSDAQKKCSDFNLTTALADCAKK